MKHFEIKTEPDFLRKAKTPEYMREDCVADLRVKLTYVETHLANIKAYFFSHPAKSPVEKYIHGRESFKKEGNRVITQLKMVRMMEEIKIFEAEKQRILNIININL